jgi:NTE family protein
LHERIGNFIDGLKNKHMPSVSGKLEMFDIVYQTFDAMQGTIARQKLAAYPPDRVVTIARNASRALEFDRADEMIALGYESARQQLGN